MWTMPSRSLPTPTKRPNSVMFLTSPSTSLPMGWAVMKACQGLSWVCLMPRLTRRLTGSTSRISTSTS